MIEAAPSTYTSCAYVGTVVHKRHAPKRHAFAYRVFSLCLDVDEIDRLDRDLRFFSRNRSNLIGFHDRDFGAGADERIGSHVRNVLRDAGLAEFGEQIRLLCYPRLLNYVFNPLSVYFCYAAGSRLGVIIYEVSNTFAERKSYVIAVESVGACPGAEKTSVGACPGAEKTSVGSMIAQACGKEMAVSPFTSAVARYSFHVRPPGGSVLVGVDLIEAEVPVLETRFTGQRLPLSDRALLGLVARYPLMTAKVVAGIHFEAVRLWLKGVPLVPRHTSPPYSYTVVRPPVRDAANAQ